MLLPIVFEPHLDPSLLHSENDTWYTAGESEHRHVDPEQPPVPTHICGTPHLHNCLASEPIIKQYLDIFNEEFDILSPSSCKEENRLAHCCIKRNLSRAPINKLFRNPRRATISNFISSDTLFKRLYKVSYMIGIDSWKSGNMCYNCLANANNLRDHDYTGSFYSDLVECIEVLIQQPAVREHLSYAQAK